MVDRSLGSLRQRQQDELKRIKERPKSYWPSWRYGPKGQSEIFQSEDEVPDGWVDHPSKVGKTQPKKPEFEAENIVEGHDDVKALTEMTVDQLVAILADASEERPEVEFAPKWPKLKLAQTIVHFGLVPADLHNKDD